MFNLDNIKKIKGYDKIGANKQMFEKFIPNFIKCQGTDGKENFNPISVQYVKDAEGKYLKFTYEMYDRKEWLHVTSARDWY